MLDDKALLPSATLSVPVVFALKDSAPIAVFEPPVKLFKRDSKGHDKGYHQVTFRI